MQDLFIYWSLLPLELNPKINSILYRNYHFKNITIDCSLFYTSFSINVSLNKHKKFCDKSENTALIYKLVTK